MKQKFKTIKDVQRRIAQLQKKLGPFKLDYEKEFPIGRRVLANPGQFLSQINSLEYQPDSTVYAFQSLWTKPLGDVMNPHNACMWDTRLAFLCSLCLSAALLRKHYSSTRLSTDNNGVKLTEALGLGKIYSRVVYQSTLQDFQYSKDWNRGKVAIIQRVAENMIGGRQYEFKSMLHVDLDVLLFAALPKMKGAYLVQGRESVHGSELISKLYLQAIDEVHKKNHLDGLQFANLPYAYNTGIYQASGTVAYEQTKIWTDKFLALASSSFDLGSSSWAIEQLCIGQIFRYDPKFVGYLFSKYFSWEKENPYGYVHFMAHSKKNKTFCNMLIDIVEREMPEYFERCRKLC